VYAILVIAKERSVSFLVLTYFESNFAPHGPPLYFILIDSAHACTPRPQRYCRIYFHRKMGFRSTTESERIPTAHPSTSYQQNENRICKPVPFPANHTRSIWNTQPDENRTRDYFIYFILFPYMYHIRILLTVSISAASSLKNLKLDREQSTSVRRLEGPSNRCWHRHHVRTHRPNWTDESARR
jgi:hypothetical protein